VWGVVFAEVWRRLKHHHNSEMQSILWFLALDPDTMFRTATRCWGFTAMDLRGTQPTDKFMLWVDAVGGYWACLADHVTLGQPLRSGSVDVPILGDISSRHARIRRDVDGYVIEAIRDVRLDGRPVSKLGWLADGSRITLGDGVRLVFRRPHALSATARLDFASQHRTQPSTDAVLLMADSCVLGPNPRSHVVCRDWPQEVILYRHDEGLFCRTRGPFEIDGQRCQDRGRLTLDSRVEGEGFSLKLEKIRPETRYDRQ
jgi:hypothetical protein